MLSRPPWHYVTATTDNEAASAFHVQQGMNHFVKAGAMSLTLLELPLTLGDRCSKTMEGIKMTKVIVEETAKNFIRVEERSASSIPPQSHTRPAKINSQAQYTKHRIVSVCSPVEDVNGSVGSNEKNERFVKSVLTSIIVGGVAVVVVALSCGKTSREAFVARGGRPGQVLSYVIAAWEVGWYLG